MSVGKNSFSSTQKNVLGVLSQGTKWPRHKSDHPFPYHTQINSKCSHTSNPPLRLHSGTETNLCIRATAVFTLDFPLYLHISHSSYHSALDRTVYYVTSNMATCFDHSVVIFRPLNHIKLKFHLQVHFCVVRLR